MAPQKAKKKLKRAINGRRPKLSHQEAQTDEELGAFLAHVSELSAATNRFDFPVRTCRNRPF